MNPAQSLEKQQLGNSAHRLGVCVNAALAILKLWAGIAVQSKVLIADGVHSLADTLTTLVAWVSFRWASKPPDEDHTYGHGKAEAVAAAMLGVTLVIGGAALLVEMVEAEPGSYEGLAAWVAVAVAATSVSANEWLYRVARRAADRLGSPSLEAVARDNRSDSLSSLLVIVGVGANTMGAPRMESFAAGMIGAFICVMGLKTLREGFDVLMDRVPDGQLTGRIRELALAVPGVVGIQRVAVHPLGRDMRVDLELSVDGGMTVREGHEIAHKVEARVVQAEERVQEVAVHVNPE